MYIQLTTKCNMTCEHCCMNATSKGENMTWQTFKRAIEMSSGYVTLGGGEPTMHPQFEKFLLYAIASAEEGVFIIINGKITERAMMLAKLAKAGVIGAELSQDEWHDSIDSKVVQAFTKNQGRSGDRDNDTRRIRNVTHHVLRRGRAASEEFNKQYETLEGCSCDGDPFVIPNGDVKQCGCDDAPTIGNVFDGWDEPEEWQCHRKSA